VTHEDDLAAVTKAAFAQSSGIGMLALDIHTLQVQHASASLHSLCSWLSEGSTDALNGVPFCSVNVCTRVVHSCRCAVHVLCVCCTHSWMCYVLLLGKCF
jgi:hypothetical protein